LQCSHSAIEEEASALLTNLLFVIMRRDGKGPVSVFLDDRKAVGLPEMRALAAIRRTDARG